MAEIIVSLWSSLDGFVAGADGNMDWLRADSDLSDYEIELVDNAGALLLGRITYSDFAGYWPAVANGTIAADDTNRRYARRLDDLDKFVASKTPVTSIWHRTTSIGDVNHAEISRIKDSVQGDIIVYGSLTLIETLNRLEMIDQVHLIVHPVMLGHGRPILSSDQRMENLELISCQSFSSGAVLMRYAVGARP